MKHYSASLEFDAQVDQGNLTITAEDALIITDINDLTDTEVATLSNAEGLYIIGGSIDTATTTAVGGSTDSPGAKYYLSGKGQQKQLKAIQSAFVSNAPGADPDTGFQNFVGAPTIYLSYSEGIVQNDLITGTANTSGATNNVATFFGTGLGFQLPLPEGTVDTNVKQAIFNDSDSSDLSVDFYLSTGNSEGDTAHFELDVEPFFNNTNNTIPILSNSSGTSYIDSSITQDGSGHVSIGATGGGNDRNLTVWGNLIVQGATTTVNTNTIDVEDQYITTAHTDLTADKSATPGGIFVEHEITGTSGTQEVTYAGLRYGNGNGSGFAWETTNDATSDNGLTGTWTAIGSGAGTVNKFAADISFADGATSVTVAAGTVGTQVTTGGNSALRHGLVQDGDYTVTLYEYVDSSGDRVDDGTTSVAGWRTVLPAYIEISSANYGVTISMPAESGSQVFKLVIKA